MQIRTRFRCESNVNGFAYLLQKLAYMSPQICAVQLGRARLNADEAIIRVVRPDRVARLKTGK